MAAVENIGARLDRISRRAKLPPHVEVVEDDGLRVFRVGFVKPVRYELRLVGRVSPDRVYNRIEVVEGVHEELSDIALERWIDAAAIAVLEAFL